jgi:hypothetical protein
MWHKTIFDKLGQDKFNKDVIAKSEEEEKE